MFKNGLLWGMRSLMNRKKTMIRVDYGATCIYWVLKHLPIIIVQSKRLEEEPNIYWLKRCWTFANKEFWMNFFFSLSKPLLEYYMIIPRKWANYFFLPTELAVAILKFLSSLFLYQSWKLYFECKKVAVLGRLTHAKTKESFPFPDLFPENFFAYMHLCSVFFGVICGDKISWKQRGGEVVSLAFKVLVLSMVCRIKSLREEPWIKHLFCW